jgi:glucose-1-phosphate adenylyltransferase
MTYAGSFRLIDIPLSNALHSQLSNVWVIEQYRPHSLNEQLANGRPWDLDRTYGGLRVLPPYEGGDRDGFARGNADAIHQHRQLIREFDPDLILVLSADHIYRIDYREVIEQHGTREADLTMVVTEVAVDKASRFGVVEVNDSGRVEAFAYKPDAPTSNVVTTEIFVYDADVLLDTLEALADEEGDDAALEDYGHELLPHLVEHNRVFAHHHEGYWRDVGTIESYWRGHMDLLGEAADMLFDHPDWPILTQAPPHLPARIRDEAHVTNSLIAPGADIQGQVGRSVLSPGVVVEKGATVRDAVVLEGARIAEGAQVDGAIVDRGAIIGRGAVVGAPVDDEEPVLTLIGMEVEIAAGVHVEAGAQRAPAQAS